jgi:hypothetical protein
MMPHIRPRPDDFEQMAAHKTVDALHLHYKTGRRQVRRWLAEVNMKAAPPSAAGGRMPIPAPDDFAEIAPTMSQTSLSIYYGVDHKVIRRWVKETGVSSQPSRLGPRLGQPRMPAAPKPKVKAANWRFAGGNKPVAVSSTSKTMLDLAADTLRRERFTVYRCDERGRFDLKGKYWRIGFSVLTGDELLERAAKYQRKVA